jgi:hypothetical protein
MKKYAFENIRKHSKIISVDISKVLRENTGFIVKAFDDFDEYLMDLEKQSVSPARNVTMMLACKLFNHVYSAIVLAEYGLIVDSILCGRNALETVAFHWLMQIDENAVNEYLNNEIPRPVDVRKRLEKKGVDINQIRKLYASDSQVTHVGRDGERFHANWFDASRGDLLFGGAFLPKDQEEMFKYLPALLYLFQSVPPLPK